MEILPFEEVERVAGAKIQLQQGGVTGIQQYGYYNIISAPHQGFSEDSSDEDDYMAPLAPKSEEGSVCCVCGENIPLLNKLIEHFKTHTAEVYCHLCRTKFGRVMSLAIHLKNAHTRHSFMCGICRTLFRCTWHLNGHMEKHQKDAMEVKPVVKMEQTEEISIKENIRYTDMRKVTLRDHSYCVSDQVATNDTCNAIQKHIDNDTNSTNQVSHIKTQTERLPIIDKQNDTLSFSSCPSNQSEQEHLSFKLKEENEDEDGLRETAACEVAAEEETGLMEDDESTDTDDDVNAIPPNIRDVTGYYNIISAPHQGFSEDSSDEDDYMAPLAPKSEEGSVCCVCGENIPLLNKLIEHFKTHTAEVYCHLCRTKFGCVMSLAIHLKNAHPRHSFMCGICRTLFRCTWHLNGHMEKHLKDAMEVKPVVKMEQTEEISIKENIRYTDMRKVTLRDHSYCVSDQVATNDTCNAIQKHIDNDTNSTNQVSHIKTQTGRWPIIDKQNDTLSFSSCPSNLSEQEHLSFKLKEENEDEDGLRETAACEVAAEEETGLMEDDESTDTDDDVNTDSLPPGDTAYNPDEDFSSEPNDSDSRSSSYGRHQKRRKKQTPDSKRPANRNLESVDIAEKFGFQSDSPFCCYGKFANLEKRIDDCRNKLRFACCLCSMVCENEELLLKHTTEKHPAAGYICAYCHSVFPRLDSYKNHVCLRRLTGGMNLPATLVTQLPVVPLSGQVRPSAPALYANQNPIKMIKITPAVNKISPAPDPPHLTLQQLLQTTPLVPAKVTDLVPQFVAVPQTLIRPHFPQSSCVARPKVPVHIPSVVRPLMPNLARMTLRIPTPSNPPFPSQVVVSFSPTVNVSAPCLVSANRPVLRQTPPANIRPLPVNVPLMTSVTCPTLVSALTDHNQPQIPPAQVQAPLQIVAMFVNQSRDLALQKRPEQSWRSKTIFPCRHCGAVSRQLSLKVRHRYLHRGSRLYRCQCRRSFQRQLHLLRHQVQHAESVRFVCARCGNTFEGAHKLTCHKQKHRNGRWCVKKKCKAAFDCSCGQMFTRPSALLWHMLKNSKPSKHTRKNSQSVSV
ncbi:uncharacterized protein LOC107714736 [Sinocyclocheilus rhinocerous]|uniref:uncharacterized protein LOC107714736 n=1 Tax=Sinocyclocheilus rhinocerous TaxID=307959 RepID=UPI0007B8EE8D|nr:PREDICTED: uncharacterized protein LOC107714736 [Sinocyclocheilus rhinocerous]XP_016376183.1 PREDICTED: uncharacterized protein LOC107714736 [Sinocyclocheilus rhinocerous]